ncbi:MAG: ATP-binding protein [Lachnospiraceae bacterium]|nr:ATP-binding protein [Lachnospiraceae bacterium]
MFFNKEIVSVLFPEADIIVYPDSDSCYKAIINGEVGSTLIPSARINIVRSNPLLERLSVAEMSTKISVNMLATMENRRVATIANKAILHTSATTGGLVLAENSYTEKTITIAEFFKQNAVYVFVFFGVIILLLAFLIFKLQKALVQAKQASKAKTSFLSNMSHDIRTPMNAIMGFSNLLEKHQTDPEKRQAYINKIKSSNEVLLSIINNVLEMTRIEQGTVVLDEEAGSIRTFANSIIDMFNDMMSQKSICFTRHFELSHDYLYCDQTKVREIFINLISNAYKYTNPGGTVRVDLKELPCDKDGYLLIQTTIADTGIGMSEEYLPHLFEEFTRENNTTDAKVEGTGLGMPIVKRLVEYMDGTITVTSKKGVGTTFVVTIPHRIARAEDCPSEAIDFSLEDLNGKRILLAEDNDLNAEIALEILSEVGIIIDRAEDGAVCVEKMEQAPAGYYAMILMDIQMPKMSGYEATYVIRNLSDKAKAYIPIVAMTANAFEEDRRKSLQNGMDAHIAKPLQMDVLKKTLSFILSRDKLDENATALWQNRFADCSAIVSFEATYRQKGLPCGWLIYEANGDEKIHFADRTLIDMYGCEDYEEFYNLVGGSFKNMVHPDDIDRVEEEIAAQIKQSDTCDDRVRYRIIRKDGAVRLIDDIGHKSFVEEAMPVFYVGLVDITDEVELQ